MSEQLLSSKIVVEEVEPDVTAIQPASLSDTALLGVTERGPFGPQLVQGFAAYKKLFGGFTANSDVALAAKLFFDEGGTNLWVSRVVHYTDPSNASTKTSAKGSVTINTPTLTAQPGGATGAVGPFVLNPNDTLIGKVGGGAPFTATFTGTAAVVTSTNTEAFALTDGMTLNFAVGAIVVAAVFHTASFANIGAALATEIDAVVNAAIASAGAGAVAGTDVSHHVTLTTTQEGSGASIQILAGTANTALGFTAATTTGTGNVANLAATTAAEVGTVVTGAFAATASSVVGGAPVIRTTATGPAASIQFTGGTAQPKIGFDLLLHSGTQGGTLPTLQLQGKTDGAYANQMVAEVLAASNGSVSFFDLLLLQAGAVVEAWPNLTMDSTNARYVLTVLNDPLNGSDYVQAIDLAAQVLAPQNNPGLGNYFLTGGNDGLSGLVDADYLGNVAGQTGLRSFDRTPSLRLLTVPGQATPAIHNAMLTYCEAVRFGSMFAILDPPAAQTAAEIVEYVQVTALLRESSEFGDIQWPRIKVANPNPTVYGPNATIVAPPSGALAGRYGANDAARPGGIYEAPAGVSFGRLTTALGLETDEVKDENARDLVAAALINPIVGLDGLPIHCDGSLTLKTTGDFPTIGERRGVIYIEQSLKTGLVFAKHRKIKPSLFGRLSRTTSAFLLIQLRNDAFASDDPKQAYKVDFSTSQNPPSQSLVRRVNGRIAIATAKPADFIVLRVGQDTSALEAELAAAAA